MPRGRRLKPQIQERVSFLVSALAVSVMAAEWILLVAGTRRNEMIVGAFSVLLVSAFLFYVHRCSPLRVKYAGADVAAGWRVPGYVALDAYVVVKILFRDFLSPRKACSFYRVCDFKTDRRDPRMVGRRVLATVYTTASPNSIVIGIDEAQSRMLLHQLERTGVSRMASNLGARP